ncbi:MAG TPA: SGNH/GDSL hydrolase family protein [Planctomycetota bacterium]|nr:SGNH/GDSL hydrolase family protein [Planctomycetota bacterium]
MKRTHGPYRFVGSVLAALCIAAACVPAGCRERAATPSEGENEVKKQDRLGRRVRLVEACIVGTHAYQVKLHKKSGEGDPAAFGDQGMTDAQLDALVEAQKTLLAAEAGAVKKWVEDGGASPAATAVKTLLDADLKLDGRLPVNAAADVLEGKPPGSGTWVRVRALASLLQVCLEVNRDGDVLQEMCRLYEPLGLLVGPSDLGIEDSNRAFLEVGTEIAQRSCDAPVKTTRGAWQIALRKVQNWSIKHRGVGPAEYADEVLARDDIKPLIPKIRALPPERILFLGHSFTGPDHWSTLAPMNEILRAAFAKLNPAIVVGRMGHGGMSASQARDRFLKDALAWKPDRVFVVVVVGSDADYAAMEEMSRKFKEIGCETACFDTLHPTRTSWVNPSREKLVAAAKASGLVVLEVGDQLAAHPERRDFVCLDGIHMRPSYHKFMAGELLKYLIEAKSR